VGDAAGYFDPLTGQGIHRALVTARLAARTIPGLLEDRVRSRSGQPGGSGPPDFREKVRLERYARELERILGPGRRVQREVDRAVSRPGLMEDLGVLLEKRPGLGSLLLEVTGDRLGPAALLRPDRLAEACFTHTQSSWNATPGTGVPARREGAPRGTGGDEM
jgi:flavin-dependent dehydrogenase